MEEALTVRVPESFLCPISGDLMWDPVIIFESQQTYERSSIERWFEGGRRTDPMTNEVLQNPDVRAPVRALREAIRDHLRGLPPFCDLGDSEEEWRAANVVFESTQSSLPVSRQLRDVRSGAPLERGQSGGEPAPPQPPIRGPPNAPPTAPPPRCVQTLPVDSMVFSLAVAPTGDLFSGHQNGDVRHWRGGACVATLEGHTDWVRALVVTSDGSVFSGSDDTTVREWREGRCVAELKGHTKVVTSLAAAADGSVYSGSRDKSIRQWRGGVCVAELLGHTDCVNTLAVGLAPGGGEDLYSGSDDQTIRVWRGGACVAKLCVSGGRQWMFALAVAHDGSLFSGGHHGSYVDGHQDRSRDCAIRQWRERCCVATLEGHTEWVWALAVAPDGSLFSGSDERTVRQWRGGSCVAVLEGHTAGVSALAVAPDGALFSGAGDKTIRQWRY